LTEACGTAVGQEEGKYFKGEKKPNKQKAWWRCWEKTKRPIGRVKRELGRHSRKKGGKKPSGKCAFVVYGRA